MIFCDSFDSYLDATDLATRWDYAAGAVAAGRNGNGWSPGWAGPQKALTPAYTYTCGVAYYINNAVGGTPLALWNRMVNGTIYNSVLLNIGGDGRFYFVARGVWSSGSLAAVSRQTWYFIEFQATTTINGTAIDGVVRVNGTQILSASVGGLGVIAESTKVPWNVVGTSGIGGGNTNYIDDFYVTSGGFLGDSAVRVLRPNAEGSALMWTPSGGGLHYNEIKEATPDYDVTYIFTANVGDEDLCGLEDIAGSGVVKAIQSVQLAKHNEVGNPAIRPTYIFGGVAHDGPADLPVAGGYKSCVDATDINPETGLPFTLADVNGMQLGARRTV